MRYLGLFLCACLSGCGPDGSAPSQSMQEALLTWVSQKDSQMAGHILTGAPVSDPMVLGYKVHIGAASRQYPVQRDIGNVTSFSVNLPGKHTWYFVVTAYNSEG